MSWREERDALIAQTLAFVQSVTGKPADFAQLAPAPAVAPQQPDTPSATVPPVSAPAEHQLDAADAAAYDFMRAEAAVIDAAMRLVSHNPPSPPAVNGAPRPTTIPATESARISPPAASPASGQPNGPADEFSGEHFTSISTELGLQRDVQAEIRARVASFRAHQERFNRERQEYFSSTLAKLRASMDDGSQSDK